MKRKQLGINISYCYFKCMYKYLRTYFLLFSKNNKIGKYAK